MRVLKVVKVQSANPPIKAIAKTIAGSLPNRFFVNSKATPIKISIGIVLM